MDSSFISNRKPIYLLTLRPGLEVLTDKFDMYTETKATLKLAAKFALLEHILRVTTSKREADDVLNTLSDSLRPKINDLLRRKTQEAQQPLHELAVKVTPDELKSMPDAKIVIYSYKYQGEQITFQVNEGEKGRLPVCYILEIERIVYILYTPQMSTLDGYDCFTGNTIFPILTEEMMLVFSNSLYSETTGFSKFREEKEGKSYVETRGKQLYKENKDSIHEERFEEDYSESEHSEEESYSASERSEEEGHSDSDHSEEENHSEHSEEEGHSEHSSHDELDDIDQDEASESENRSEFKDLTDSESDHDSEEIKHESQQSEKKPMPGPKHDKVVAGPKRDKVVARPKRDKVVAGPKREKPKVEKWKEVEQRIIVEKKQRDSCGSACMII